MANQQAHLARNFSILGLVATGISSMIGASIYIVPFMLQKNVPGIGPYILLAFFVAAIPALLAALTYAILASAMPRAGGSYVYASRSIHPYWGFVASFSQWFGLSFVIGVVAYMVVPFFRDVCVILQWNQIAIFFEYGNTRLFLSLAFLWFFIAVNIVGIKTYQVTIITLVIVTFVLASIVILVGFIYTEQDFINAIQRKEGRSIVHLNGVFEWKHIISASAILFASFIGFDSIAQAGGEAKNPSKTIPKAIIITIVLVSSFYLLFTFSVYKVVPWNFIAEQANLKDISAPSLLSYILSPFWSILIMLGACIALLKDLPSMILSVSRLVFAWSKDGLFPGWLINIHPTFKTPYWAILFSGMVSSLGILGSHFASDIFLGIDIMVISMLINFVLICIAVLMIKKNNPSLAMTITTFKNRTVQILIALLGFISLSFLLWINVKNDLQTERTAWYFHATYIWLVVMLMGSVIFGFYWVRLKKTGMNTNAYFKQLPPE